MTEPFYLPSRKYAFTVAFIGGLFESNPSIMGLFAEHLVANEAQVLPYMLLPDVARWATAVALTTPDDPVLRAVLDYIESRFVERNADVNALIATSFLDFLTGQGPGEPEVRALLGPSCAAELESWK